MLTSIILNCGWDVFRLAMACKFFGGLTNVRRLAWRRLSTESAGDGEKRRRSRRCSSRVQTLAETNS